MPQRTSDLDKARRELKRAALRRKAAHDMLTERTAIVRELTIKVLQLGGSRIEVVDDPSRPGGSLLPGGLSQAAVTKLQHEEGLSVRERNRSRE